MLEKAGKGRKSKGGKKSRRETTSTANEFISALEAIRNRQKQKKRKHRGKQHHIDEYRELVIGQVNPGQFSQALLELSTETYARRRYLSPDEGSRVNLPAGAKSDEESERQAAQAAQEVRENMKKRGVPERKHYYRVSERTETGEIDRTYEIKRKSKWPEGR